MCSILVYSRQMEVKVQSLTIKYLSSLAYTGADGKSVL